MDALLADAPNKMFFRIPSVPATALDLLYLESEMLVQALYSVDVQHTQQLVVAYYPVHLPPEVPVSFVLVLQHVLHPTEAVVAAVLIHLLLAHLRVCLHNQSNSIGC